MIIAFLSALWSRVGLRTIQGLYIVLAILGVLFAVKRAFDQAEKADQYKKRLKSIGEGNEIEDTVARMPDGAALDELRRKWSHE